MIRRLAAAALLGLALLGPAGPLSACPACKEAMAAQRPDEATRLRTGYFYSIILMVSMPLVLAGVGIAAVARAVKRGTMPEL
ncbi:MAG: hypothetical protein KatS3mg108_2955 [Isosphaeraceae bacterium]|jgi:hypothetical protein|nr:MAG: hypothetical protein KatS3mg108_2955 [Isosphaeraceae bacterium]